MKLSSILQSQAIRLGKISGPGGGSIYGLNLAKACEERYGFLQGPRTLADYDLTKGITFLHGYFSNFVIDRLQIFPNGVVVEAKVQTDECDRFLDDLLKWITERGGIEFHQQTDPGGFLYVSHLEVQADIDLDPSFSKFSAVGKQIGDILRGYGQATPDYRVSGILFGAGWNDTGGFRFEGREGNHPYGTFFTQARLKTSDHLRVLDSLEFLLRTTAA